MRQACTRRQIGGLFVQKKWTRTQSGCLGGSYRIDSERRATYTGSLVKQTNQHLQRIEDLLTK